MLRQTPQDFPTVGNMALFYITAVSFLVGVDPKPSYPFLGNPLLFGPVLKRIWGVGGVLLWMDEILHHLRSPGMLTLLKIPANNGVPRFQTGAKWISFIHSRVLTHSRYSLYSMSPVPPPAHSSPRCPSAATCPAHHGSSSCNQRIWLWSEIGKPENGLPALVNETKGKPAVV